MTEKKRYEENNRVVSVKISNKRKTDCTSSNANISYKHNKRSRMKGNEEVGIKDLRIRRELTQMTVAKIKTLSKNNEKVDYAVDPLNETSRERDSDRDRASSESSHTIVESEDYEPPVTRSSTRTSCRKYKNTGELDDGGDDAIRYKGISGDTQVGRYSSSTTSLSSNKKRKSSAINAGKKSTSFTNSSVIKRTTNGETKSPQHKQRKVSYSSFSLPVFPVCNRHGQDNQSNGSNRNNNNPVRGRLCIKDFEITDKTLGEGQIGKVFVAYYRGLPVACKTKRRKVSVDNYEIQVARELRFAAKLSACKYMNRYVGWFSCPEENKNQVKDESSNNMNYDSSICIVQRYIPNGDSRKYLYKRVDPFMPFEVLQATICLFTALKDAHSLDIGIVDLKLENFLIDSAGSGWITDFGSCVEFDGEKILSLDEEGITWTTHVASPEMISNREFRKSSDVFMATLIAAELMTGDLTDEAFQEQVLRRQPNGTVNFSSQGLNKKFRAFFKILEEGLKNDPEERPTAEAILQKLIELREISFRNTY